MHKDYLRAIGLVLFITTLIAGSACSHVNVKQIAYEVLRQEDCRINQLDDFCTRTFASEYRAYELMRQEYIRSQEETVWRVSQVNAKIGNP